MTESEAIKCLEYTKRSRGMPEYGDKWEPNGETIALDMAIKALEEIQKYRSIGTVERFEQLSEQFKPHTIDEASCPKRQCNKCDKYRKENEKYREIGTVSECREARERQEEKRPVMKPESQSPHYKNDTMIFCPTCNKRLRVKYKERFCCGCGQKLDWSNA